MKNVFLFFLKSLIKSLFLILVIIGVGVGSYFVSYKVLKTKQPKENSSLKELEDIKSQAKTDKISKNLIFVIDDKERVVALLLEVCNTETKNMDYVTIPVKTLYTIPAKMYRKLTLVSDQIPQVARITKLKQYFSNNKDAYGYATLVVEKMTGVEFSYYTVLNKAEFKEKYTKKKSVKQKYMDGNKKKSVKMDTYVMKDEYISKLLSYGDDQLKIEKFIKDDYEKIDSNLTVYSKIGYVEAYASISPECFHYWTLPAKKKGSSFYTIDTDVAKTYINNIINNKTTYTDSQFGQLTGKGTSTSTESSDPEASSETKSESGDTVIVSKPGDGEKASACKGKKIILLNGSKINGLAAKFKTRLSGNGFTVSKVGNYTNDVHTQTEIVVPKEGDYSDLESYFSNPKITVGTVDSGYDIKIILGTVDAN
ncbi:MAG: LCP family protein [Lachnospiraceae bacterium]|nr:LCP family protein [Lachnospiraceae bacterium]